jgi:CHASE1-domain containing sensor protein
MSTPKSDSTCGAWHCEYVPAAIVLVLGTVLSITIFYAAYSWEQNAFRRHFDSLAEDRYHAIANVFDESQRMLDFADNVFLLAPPADSPQFVEYVRSLRAFLQHDLSKYPSLHALTWVPRVPRTERAAYVRAARAVFDPRFQFDEPGNSAATKSDALPPDCFPSYLRIAAAPDRDRSGKDLSLDPAVWKAMQQARDTGAAVAIAPIKISTAANDRFGYRVFLPLYKNDDPGAIATRRQALTGYLSLDLDVGRLVERALAGIQPVGVDVSACDETDAKSVTLCRHSSRLHPSEAASDGQKQPAEFESSDPTTLFGRRLTFRCRTSPSFWVDRTIWQPWLLLCGGLAMTMVIAGYRMGRAVRNIAIERAVAARMDTLRQDIARQSRRKAV